MVNVSADSDKDSLWLRLAGVLFFFLCAYTFAQPFRDIYGPETCNALMAREMIEDRMSLIPKALGQPYPDYPPLYFWLETMFSKPLGHITTLSTVLPSALSAVGILALTFFLGRSINVRTGWLSVLILATIPKFWLEAGSVTIDMLLAFNTTAAILCLYSRDKCHSSGKRIAYAVGATTFILFAFFTKGLIGVVLPAISWGGYLFWERRWKNLFAFAFFIIFVGLLCMAIELSIVYNAGGRQLFDDVLRMQITGRITEKANKSFSYYPICLLEIGNIWWLVILYGFTRFHAGKSEKSMFYRIRKTATDHPANRLAIIWFLGILAVFTLASSKHSRYLLPLYPAAALIITFWAENIFENGHILFANTWRYIINILTGMILLAGLVYPLFYKQFIFIPAALILIWFAAGITLCLLARKQIEVKYRLAGSILSLFMVGLTGSNLMVIPAFSRKASGRTFIETVESKFDSNLPLVIYNIKPDGDGVKFALYSKRKPSSIRFVKTLEELNLITKPCLLISRFDNKIGFKDLISGKNCNKLSEGRIYSKKFVACLLGSGE